MASQLTKPVRDLLAAVAEALTIPLPIGERADQRAYHQLLEQRSFFVRINLLALVEEVDADLTLDAVHLRKCTAEMPVTYTKAGDE